MIGRSGLILLIVLLILVALPPVPVQIRAQGGESCPALVSAALQAVDAACAGLGRDEACYGHSRVDAAFWQARDDLVFSVPADRVPLADVQTLTTAPLDPDSETWGIAALNVRANVPEALPGQAVTFLLMGDATLENAVTPEEAAQPVTPVEAAAAGTQNANLRSGPGTTYNVVAAAAPGEQLALIGVSVTGDWYEVALESGGSAWIRRDLFSVPDTSLLASLPVSDPDAPRYGPMQAFYFTTGLSEPACIEAPNALVVQSPGGVEAALRVNGLDVRIGSTIVLALSEVQTASGPVPVMLIALLDGHLEFVLNDQWIALDQADPTPDSLPVVALTLNGDFRVDENTRVVEPPVEAIMPVLQNACQDAHDSGILGGFSADVCSADPAPLAEAAVATPPPPTQLSDIGPDDPCAAAAFNFANLRSGPGTSYPVTGQIAFPQAVPLDGYTDGADGYRWWRLSDGNWVRGDLVQTAGACGALATVETPQPPIQPTAVPGGSGSAPGGASFIPMTFCSLSRGGVWPEPVARSVTISTNWGDGDQARVEALVNAVAMSLTINGMDQGPAHGFQFDTYTSGGCPVGYSRTWNVTLAPGTYQLTTTYTATGSVPGVWVCGTGGTQTYDWGPGSSQVYTCTITIP